MYAIIHTSLLPRVSAGARLFLPWLIKSVFIKVDEKTETKEANLNNSTVVVFPPTMSRIFGVLSGLCINELTAAVKLTPQTILIYEKTQR